AAIYVDYLVLPPSSIPRAIAGSGGAGVVSLPSSILPANWVALSDNEKLAWIYLYRQQCNSAYNTRGGNGGSMAQLQHQHHQQQHLQQQQHHQQNAISPASSVLNFVANFAASHVSPSIASAAAAAPPLL